MKMFNLKRGKLNKIDIYIVEYVFPLQEKLRKMTNQIEL